MGDSESLRVFALGALGGILVELVRWWKLREATEFPVYAKKWGYWAITLLMIAAGGITATLYGLDTSNAAALVNIGASTPAILGALAAKPERNAAPEEGPSGLEGRSFRSSSGQGLAHSELVRRFIAFGH